MIPQCTPLYVVTEIDTGSGWYAHQPALVIGWRGRPGDDDTVDPVSVLLGQHDVVPLIGDSSATDRRHSYFLHPGYANEMFKRIGRGEE